MAVTAAPPPNAAPDPREIGRELIFTALVACALIFPIVTLRAEDNVLGLQLVGRWHDSAIALLLVVLGRLGTILLRYEIHMPVLIGGLIAFGLGMVSIITGGLGAIPTVTLKVLLALGGGILAIQAARAIARASSSLTAAERNLRASARQERFQASMKILAGLAIAFAVVLPFLPFSSRYVVDVATLIITYVMLGWGLNIIVGYAGLLDLGYVAFYAVGAYSYAISAPIIASFFGFAYDGTSFWIALPVAGILAALSGVLLGFPVLRLRGDYFAIVTLGFGEIIRIILINWYNVTGGPDGIAGIPRPDFFGMAVFRRSPVKDENGEVAVPAFHDMFGLEYSTEYRVIFLYFLILLLALIVAWVNLRVRNLPIGRAWEALREDDIACASLGLNRTMIKLAAFGTSAAFGGIAGSFFATRQGFISPESFTFIESAIILAIVVLGGMGNLIGIALAAILLIGVPEIFRELSEYRMIAFGAGLVLVMIWRPQGLISHREPSVRLHPRGFKPDLEKAAAAQAAHAGAAR